MSKTSLQFSAICALTSPIIFATVVCVIANLQPGYSHIHQYISELGALGEANALRLNYLGIFWFGLSLIIFIPAFYQLIRPGSRASAVCGLLILTGIGFMVLAVYPCDVGCSLNNLSLTAQIHNNAAIMSFVLMIAVTGTLSVRRFSGHQPAVYYAFCLVITVLLAFIFIKIMLVGYQGAYAGLFQRLFIGVFSVWLIGSAWLALGKIMVKH